MKIMCALWNYLVENPVIITGIIAIGGWVIVHILSKRRDFRNKQREIRIQYLTNAWQKVVRASAIREQKDLQLLPDALFDIQLLGTHKQIKLVKQLLADIFDKSKNGVWDAKELTNNLRNKLRRELGLRQTHEEVLGLKVRDNNTNPQRP